MLQERGEIQKEHKEIQYTSICQSFPHHPQIEKYFAIR